MASPTPTSINQIIDGIYRTESRRILATLIRLLGDFEAAEEAMHDAFNAALEKWPSEGVPKNPRAWLVSAGKFRAIDALRRHARFDSPNHDLDHFAAESTDPADAMDESVADDQLRLIFTCCHPALAPDARIALTLREVCGLTTEEIARAYLTSPSTIAQRIVRAKSKIRDSKIPYEVPSTADLAQRLDTALHAVYLVFNEGYSASSGDSLTRSDLSGEALRLGRLLLELLPEPEVAGLLSLMLLQDSRRRARTGPGGDLILLENQDRALWDNEKIAEGIALAERALASREFGTYTIQAAIAAEHSGAGTTSETNWGRIVALYDTLLRLEPSPVVELNRAVAIAMRDGPEAGLELVDAIIGRGELSEYHLIHSARAELCRRLGKTAEARVSYVRALDLARLAPERRFLEHRMSELPPS